MLGGLVTTNLDRVGDRRDFFSPKVLWPSMVLVPSDCYIRKFIGQSQSSEKPPDFCGGRLLVQVHAGMSPSFRSASLSSSLLMLWPVSGNGMVMNSIAVANMDVVVHGTMFRLCWRRRLRHEGKQKSVLRMEMVS